jgi:signal transduction histidine kinase
VSYALSSQETVHDRRTYTSGWEARRRSVSQSEKEYQQLELKLRDALAYAQSIIDALREPVIVLDDSLRVRTASRSFYEKFNVSAEETEGAFLYDLENGLWNIPRLRTLLDEVVAKDLAFRDLEIVQDIPSLGEKRVMLLNAQKLWREGNNSELLLLAIEDVTNRQRAKEEIENALAESKRHAKELERSNEDLKQFAHIASHDLKSPLQTVLQFTQLLERKYKHQFDEEASSYFGFIAGGVERMRTLINDLLRYSQVSTAKAPTSGPIASEASLEVALVNLQADITDRGAVITHDELPILPVDPTQLLQLFQNLIGNALHYRSDDQPHVHVSAVRQGAFWLFSVRDNGVGIEPEYHETIFEPFKRLHGSERPGSGIGLAICKRIVERYGGRIWVHSAVDKGSTFYFTLPS